MKNLLSAVAGRDAESLLREQAMRVLVERRCDVYCRAAGLLMDLEDAIDREDADRVRYAFEELRRALRSALAFLSDDVCRALERAEAVFSTGGERVNGARGRSDEDLRDRLRLLHVRLARLLKLPGQDVVEVMGLESRLVKKLEEDEAATEERAKRRELEERLKGDERVARELIAQKQHKKALRHLKRAVRLDPERAVLRNDLGVVYGLLGCHEQAVEEYRAAVALNEKHRDRRTDEWSTSYRNLGIALTRLSREEEEIGESERALVHAREAKGAFEEYVKVTPDGPKLAEARALVRRLEEEVRFLEGRAKAEAEAEAQGCDAAEWHCGAE